VQNLMQFKFRLFKIDLAIENTNF
jgi:hypothetical protein